MKHADRMLLHGLDACTASVGTRKRKRRQHGSALTIALALATLALLYFGSRMV